MSDNKKITFIDKAGFIAFLDQARWSNGENYYDINYSNKVLTPDQQLLTHWLCYISDRQMDFMQIWDVGGFVYSNLVYEYFNNVKNVEDLKDLLDPKNKNGKSFFVSNNDPAYMFISKLEANDLIKNRYEGFTHNDKAKFTPRYYPSDYISIYYTLYILQGFDKSFTKYIAQIINKALNCCEGKDENEKAQTIMECLFCGLYVLTYSNIGQPTSDFLNEFPNTKSSNEEYIYYINNNKTPNADKCVLLTLDRIPEKRLKAIKDWIDGDDFINYANIVYKENRFSSKRIWCCIRDYLKHTYDKNEGNKKGFKDLFGDALKVPETTIEYIFSDKMIHHLELPGDIWNNNSTFGKCLLNNIKYKYGNRTKLNKILDYIIQKNNELNEFYPEQFDVTFNFVPRMCEQGKCKYCPMWPDHGGSQEKIKKLCSGTNGSFCPAVLTYTGYFYECKGQKGCRLKELINP